MSMSKVVDKAIFGGGHTCPWWICFTFDNPIRTWIQDPEKLIAGFVKPGDAVLDIGPGQGYFTLPMAKRTAENGKVVALDIQAKMLELLKKRALEAKCTNIATQLYDGTHFGLEEKFAFILMFWMFHEVRNKDGFLKELKAVSTSKTRILLVEPIVHVAKKDFEATVDLFMRNGFETRTTGRVRLSRAIEFAIAQGS
jgi:ubiquinone/menaquinone biosynthesis C-methylase UbiE